MAECGFYGQIADAFRACGLPFDPSALVRIGNSLDWMRYVVMNEAKRVTARTACRKPRASWALNIVEADASKGSNYDKFKCAGWDDAFLAKLLAQV